MKILEEEHMRILEEKMKHNSRCENAKQRSKCKCKCGGRYHAINTENKDGDDNRYIRAVNASLGGEAGRTIKILSGVPFTCTCGKKQVLGGFLGYPHAGGLDDKDGNRWWVFYECIGCEHQWSWGHLVARITQQQHLQGADE